MFQTPLKEDKDTETVPKTPNNIVFRESRTPHVLL
jgi:hypothetical protein